MRIDCIPRSTTCHQHRLRKNSKLHDLLYVKTRQDQSATFDEVAPSAPNRVHSTKYPYLARSARNCLTRRRCRTTFFVRRRSSKGLFVALEALYEVLST